MLYRVQLITKGRLRPAGLAGRLELRQTPLVILVVGGRLVEGGRIGLRLGRRLEVTVMRPLTVLGLLLVLMSARIAPEVERLGIGWRGRLRSKERRMLAGCRKRLVATPILWIVVGRVPRVRFGRCCVVGVVRPALRVAIRRLLRGHLRPLIRLMLRGLAGVSGRISFRSVLPILGLAAPASHRTVRP